MGRVTALALAAAMAGCATLVRHAPRTDDRPSGREDVRAADRIVVTVASSGAPGRSWESRRCVFQDRGRCYGEHTSGGDRVPPADQTRAGVREFPPEAFREVKQILLDSPILTLKPGEPGFVFESSRSVSVECGGRALRMTWENECKECQPLCAYIDKLWAGGATGR